LNNLAPLEYVAQLENGACTLTLRLVQESRAPHGRLDKLNIWTS